MLGVSDEMGKLMRFRPELVMAAASDSCESHLYNHAQRRAHVLEAVGADPVDSRTPKASKPLAEAATALRQTYRKQLAAIMAHYEPEKSFVFTDEQAQHVAVFRLDVAELTCKERS